MPQPKCPKCSHEMTAGHLTGMLGAGPGYTQAHLWVAGTPVLAGQGGNRGAAPDSQEHHILRALRCPACGMVELYAHG